jgi:transposase
LARQLQIEWQEDAATLYARYKQEKDYQKRTRLQALWLVRQGHGLRQVADTVGVHCRTVQEWLAWYRQGGLAEVLRHRWGGHGGKARRLTADQEAALRAQASRGAIRTIQDGVAWARKTCRVDYSYWGMRWVFDRLELKKKVPRPRHPKASVEEQAAWKKGASRPS